MTTESLQAAMTAPLTAEQAREVLHEELMKLRCCDALHDTALELINWRSVNIGSRRMRDYVNEASAALIDAAVRMESALDVLTREQKPALTWIERIKAKLIGGRSH